MRRLELTLATPAENLALDEALLDLAEAESSDCEFLRLWESPRPIVVVGRSSRIAQEVDQARCDERGIPILRRSSGGAAIVAGPGCLMYGVVLSYALRPELKDLSRAHSFVLGRLADGLRSRIANVRCAGTSDLVVADGTDLLKFSGNSLRAKRSHVLYHGTLMFALDLSQIDACLRQPPRQPTYRASRSHAEFVTNLPIGRLDLTAAVDRAFPTTGQLVAWPWARVEQLVGERFGRDDWNLVFG
jgi:lipoate---protein ligase